MKKVIICEGKNDGVLLKKLFKKLKVDDEHIKIFSQKNVTIKTKKHDESNVLRSFMKRSIYNPKKILIKLEGGKDSATKIFCRELINCLCHMDDLILLLDADHENIISKIEHIKKFVRDAYSPTTALCLSHEEKSKSEHLSHSVVNVSMVANEQALGSFQIILFSKSLEHSCGITDEDKPEDRETKIENFIDADIKQFFSDIINFTV